MKSISIAIIALSLLPAQLGRPLLPAGIATAASPVVSADPDRICQQNAAANVAAQKRLARQLKVSPREVFPSVSLDDQLPPLPGGDKRIKGDVIRSLSRCYKASEGLVSASLRSANGCLKDDCPLAKQVKFHTSVFFAKGRQRTEATMPVSSIGEMDQDLYSLNGAFDFDGDGVPEVILVNETYEQGEDWGTRTFKLQSLKGGKLVDYASSPPLNADSRMEDVDKDDRPDFYSPGTYAQIKRPQPGPADDPPAVRSQFVYHSLPGGRFSTSDAVARAALDKVCPIPVALSMAAARSQAAAQKGFVETVLLQSILCARARGKSAAEVLQALRPDCAQWEDSGELEENGDFTSFDGLKKSKNTCPLWLREVIITPSPLEQKDG